jgi:hypothetical protein
MASAFRLQQRKCAGGVIKDGCFIRAQGNRRVQFFDGDAALILFDGVNCADIGMV